MFRTMRSWILVFSLCLVFFGDYYTMPDAPDDYGLFPESSIDVVNDLGELAARGVTISPLHRSGNVVFWDNFGQGLGNLSFTAANGALDPVLSASNGYNSGYSAKLETNTNINAGIDCAKWLGGQFHGGIGFDAIIANQPTNTRNVFTIVRSMRDDYKLAQVEINTADLIVYLYRGPATKTPIYTMDSDDLKTFIQTDYKLVVDFTTGYYKRFYIGPQLIDIDQYPLIDGSINGGEYVEVVLNFKNLTAARHVEYISGYAVTIGEP